MEKCESSFVVGNLGRAASPRPPSWAIGCAKLSAGVLGETAPARAGRRRALGFWGASA